MNDIRIHVIDRPSPSVRAQRLTPNEGGRKGGGKGGGFWDVLG